MRRTAFVTAALLVTTAAWAAAPAIVFTTPARNAQAAGTTTISMTFDQPLLPASVTASSFRVFGKQTGTATGPVTFSNSNQTVTLTPSRVFAAGEVVLVNVSHDVLAADSTPVRGAGFAWQFSIAAVPSAGTFQQIDVMSNRTGGPGGPQTRIYGALQADLDQDGWIDLTTVNEVSGDLRVFMNRGDGTGLYHPFLQPPFPIGLEASPNEPADFDNDGQIDVVVSAASGGGIWIGRGDGDGTFSGSQSVLTGNEPHGVAVLDVDGDGDPDIVEAIQGDDHLAVLLNNGAGVFGAPTYFDSGCGGEWALAAADMNNDYIYDVVAGCVDDSKGVVGLGNGNGTFTPLTPQNAGGPPWQVALGDVDGDGDIDAAFGNSFAANGGLLKNDGTGVLGSLDTVPTPAHTPASDLADLDGDGDLDWILSSYGAGLWRIYWNDGAGNFGSPTDIAAPSNPSCAVPVDFDNDGDIDLALSDEIADVVVLMQNTNGPSPLCPAAPAACREPALGGKAMLLLKDKSPDNGDKVIWKWLKGATTPKSDFGDPSGSDDFALCLYEDEGSGGELRASVVADHGGQCGNRPCWSDKSYGWLYRNNATSLTGASVVKMKEGLADGDAKILFRGKGLRLVMPDLNQLTGALTVQLHRSGGGPCFGATYSPPFLLSDGETLKARAD
jgi:FG-GAP-like repeat/Bacterial Ig-like domain